MERIREATVCVCKRKRVIEWRNERQGEGDKTVRKQESEIRKSEEESHDEKTNKAIKRGNGRERSWGWQRRKLPPLTILRVSLLLCL